MLATQIIGFIVYIISLFLSVMLLICEFKKNVGADRFSIFPLLFCSFPYACEVMILMVAPKAFGIAYIFIGMNMLMLLIPYCFLTKTVIFGKNYIHRLNNFLIPKKYSYKDVIRYRMGYQSSIYHRRYGGMKKIISYDFIIYFNDKKYSEFSVRKENDKKIVYIKGILEKNRCKKDGKIKL